MIIKGERIATSRAPAPLLRHLLRGEDNDRVTIVQGTEEDVRVAFADAREAGRRYALRHFIISPESETTDADALMILGLLGREFRFDAASAIGVKHDKGRAVAEAFGAHWHFLVPEVDAATGRVLDSRYNFLRHAKVAAIAAYRLGHRFVRSPHENAISVALEADGHLDILTAYLKFIEADHGAAHREAFSRDVHQMGKRHGVDVPQARAAVRAAWETTNSRSDFEAALGGHGLRIQLGDKPSTFIIETLEGVFIGAAHRLARVRRLDFRQRMEGSSNVREQPTARQRERILRASALGDPQRQTTPGSTGPARQSGGSGRGPRPNCAGVNFDGNPGSANEHRGATPAYRRNCTLRARGCARRFRKIATHYPDRFRRIAKAAVHLARPPAERVAYQLARYEELLDARLKSLLSRPSPSPALAAARRDAERLRAHIDKYDRAIAAATQRLRNLGASEPRGLGPRVDGSKGRWQQQRAAAEARCAAFTEQRSALRVQLHRVRGLISELEKGEVRRHSQLLHSEETKMRAAQIRQQFEHIRVARQQLEKLPSLAWGGIILVLRLAAFAIRGVGWLIDPNSEPSHPSFW